MVSIQGNAMKRIHVISDVMLMTDIEIWIKYRGLTILFRDLTFLVATTNARDIATFLYNMEDNVFVEMRMLRHLSIKKGQMKSVEVLMVTVDFGGIRYTRHVII